MSTAIGYIRVSTEGQGIDGISLDMQTAKIHAYCQLLDITLLGIHEDIGISGKRMVNRPGLQSVMALVDAKTIDHVVVYKLDRLARNTIETLQMVEAMDAKSVSLHSISETLDTRSAIGRFVIRTLASLAEMERDQISERTKDALRHKKNRGERIGGQPAYGWRVVDKELVQDPDGQALISRVRELRDSGSSTRQIAATLQSEGIRTRKGTVLSQTQVCRILKTA